MEQQATVWFVRDIYKALGAKQCGRQVAQQLLQKFETQSRITMPELYDIVLANGRVIDPETYTDAVLNIGINGATIVAISKEPLKGKDVVDVSGKIVSPGFIDTHAHQSSSGP